MVSSRVLFKTLKNKLGLQLGQAQDRLGYAVIPQHTKPNQIRSKANSVRLN